MLRQSIQAATPELQRFVEDIIAEESRARVKDRRAIGREPLTRAVEIMVRGTDSDRVIRAISRDISGIGIGVVSTVKVEPYTTARFSIHRLSGRPSVVNAECRWCEEHAGGWFLSGWHFVSVENA